MLKAFPHVASINRDFRLGLAAFLADRRVAPGGGSSGSARPMKGQAFVLDTVRAMLEWAADPDRGGLLPDGFRDPFLRRGEPRSVFRGDPLGEPDITLPMALNLVNLCNRFQLLLFAPMLLFGLRAAEPCYLFHEYFDGDWLRIPCNPELAYFTKGRRDKRFPLIDPLRPLWEALRQAAGPGLLYLRRGVMERREVAPLRGYSLPDLVAEFRRRCAAALTTGAAQRVRLRGAVLHDAGAMTYDHVQHEFRVLTHQLGWPAAATLKDLRHLFATALGNSAMPEAYRRYLLGQAPGRAAVVAYTHINQLREQYTAAVCREWTPLIEAINQRLAHLR
jgi:hypothetical protein